MYCIYTYYLCVIDNDVKGLNTFQVTTEIINLRNDKEAIIKSKYIRNYTLLLTENVGNPYSLIYKYLYMIK